VGTQLILCRITQSSLQIKRFSYQPEKHGYNGNVITGNSDAGSPYGNIIYTYYQLSHQKNWGHSN